MRQQINLYQPIFREQRKLFSSRIVGAGLAAVIVTLAGIYAFGSWQVESLAVQVEALRKEQLTSESRMANLGALQGARTNTKSIEDKTVALGNELAIKTRALQVLRSGGAGHTTGFSSRLEALARRHVDGLWLDHIVLASDQGAMSLSGGTINPALVPRYLQGLSSEAALSGTRFDEFVIEEAVAKKDGATLAAPASKVPAGSLRFRAGSSVVSKDPARGAS